MNSSVNVDTTRKKVVNRPKNFWSSNDDSPDTMLSVYCCWKASASKSDFFTIKVHLVPYKEYVYKILIQILRDTFLPLFWPLFLPLSSKRSFYFQRNKNWSLGYKNWRNVTLSPPVEFHVLFEWPQTTRNNQWLFIV